MEARLFYDRDGKLACVQISPDLWEKLANVASSYLDVPREQGRGEMAAFGELMRYWDFDYAYDPAVQCPHCHNSATDWRDDPDAPFILRNANIGGLLVFHCRGCGATVRHKYFKGGLTVECDPPVLAAKS